MSSSSHECNCGVMYDRNHLFGLVPIPTPKLQIGRNFRPIPKLTETVKSYMGNRDQGVCKKIACHFRLSIRQIFINWCSIWLHLYIIPIWQLFFCFSFATQTRATKKQYSYKQIVKQMEQKFRFRQKKFWPRNRYRDSILVSVTDTETRFRSYTNFWGYP